MWLKSANLAILPGPGSCFCYPGAPFFRGVPWSGCSCGVTSHSMGHIVDGKIEVYQINVGCSIVDIKYFASQANQCTTLLHHHIRWFSVVPPLQVL